MENYILISHLNDFIFCPRSIYFHKLYEKYNDRYYKQDPQIKGIAAHESIDSKKYSTRKDILQGIEIYSEKYLLFGKIDVFDLKNCHLIERKREIKKVYDGYVFQVYGQYYGLLEMGYHVEKITIHDLVHNKNYPIPIPPESSEWQMKFENLIQKIQSFSLSDQPFFPNKEKCDRCIYSNLCDYSLC